MYDLHLLGWQSFQDLCHTITSEILGQTVESFLDSSDGGRDGAFRGTWGVSGQEDLTGAFVIQCKFTSKADRVLRTSDLTDEAEKARRLVASGLCDSYVLMTNLGLSGAVDEEILKLFKSVGVKHVRTYGSTWINRQIRENQRLRLLVPRLYGLGDLSQILDERAYAQTGTILDWMREDIAKVIVTDAYRKAFDAIDHHGFVLLIGEPAAGKTTIASLLAMAALDQGKSLVLKLDEPGKVIEHWNPNESQFFWLDDAFGVTQYDDSLVRGWNQVLPRMEPMLRRGAKIVMASRDYIYNRARQNLKESAFPLFRERQVVINVHDLSIDERRQILYNHLKLGNQPRSFLTKVKPHLEDVANHDRFIPETARRLADPLFTKDLLIDKRNIDQFVERREQQLQEVIEKLDADSKAALALIYMRDGCVESPILLQPSEVEALERLGSNLGGCIAALEALKGSLVLHSQADGESAWRFRHPTIGDGYASILAQNPEHLGIFIQGSAPEKLISQVSCGDVGIENALIVPRLLFPQMFRKIEKLLESESKESQGLSILSSRGRLQSFLASRCSKEFLVLYLQRNPALLDRVSDPSLSLAYSSEVGLAKRLYDFGLLPESCRRRLIENVSEYVFLGLDASALSDMRIRSLFTDDEFESLAQRVATELLPRLSDVRLDWESDYDWECQPDAHINQILEFFDSLKVPFADDEGVLRSIDHQISRAWQWVDETTYEEHEKLPQRLGTIPSQMGPRSTRSLFDDIDATASP